MYSSISRVSGSFLVIGRTYGLDVKTSGLLILIIVLVIQAPLVAEAGLAEQTRPAAAACNGIVARGGESAQVPQRVWQSPRLPGDFGDWPMAVAVPYAADAAGERFDEPSHGAQQVMSRTPSSLLLGLTALAGLGLFQAGQTIRRVQGPLVAEWYHTGGPVQIGRATPLDLNALDLPPCELDPLVPPIPGTPRAVPEMVLRIPFELLPLTTAPRAPPALSVHRCSLCSAPR